MPPVRFPRKWAEWPPLQSHTTQSLKATSLPGLLHPSPGSWLLSRTHATWGWTTGRPEGGLTAFPRANGLIPPWKGMFSPRKMASVVWEMDSAQESWQLSLHLSLSRATTPILSLGDSNLLHPPSTGAQREWLRTRFVHWAFKRVPVSPRQADLLLIFTAICYAIALAWRAQSGVETPWFSGGTLAAEIPSKISAAALGSRTSPFVSLPFLPS